MDKYNALCEATPQNLRGNLSAAVVSVYNIIIDNQNVRPLISVLLVDNRFFVFLFFSPREFVYVECPRAEWLLNDCNYTYSYNIDSEL